MARPDASLYGEVGLDTSKLQRGVKQADGLMKGLASSMTAVGTAMSVYGIERAASYVMELGRMGAASLRLKTSFDQLAKSHQSNSQAILDALKTASQGTIAETDLILGANRAMMLGLSSNATELAQLMEVAAFRARAMGITTTQAWDNIVTGIGRKSPLILDNLGIVGLKMDDTTSKAEIMSQVIVEGQKQIAEAGGLTVDAAAQFEQLDAKIADLNTRWAELVAVPTTTKTVDFIINGLEGWEKAVAAVQAMKDLTGGAGGGIPESVTALGITLPTPTPENIFGALQTMASPQLALIGKEWGVVTGAGFQEGLAETVAGGIGAVMGPAIQQNMGQVVQQTQEAELTLKEYYSYLVRTIGTIEAGSAEWRVMRGEIAKSAILLDQFGSEATMSQMEGDVTEIYKTMGDGWPAAIRHAIWQMLPMEERLASMDAWAKELKGTIESIRPSYGDYATAEQFGPRATADVALYQMGAQADLARQAEQDMKAAMKTSADDFADKMKGANNVISGDIADKVNAALGIEDPMRGGALGGGEAPGEWWRRLSDISGGGEASPWAEAMRGDIAKVADYLVGAGAGEKVLADEGAMKAGADAILRFADQFGAAGAAGAIQLNTGVVTIDWAGAAANMQRQEGLAENIQAGGQFAAQQMGMGETTDELQSAMSSFAGNIAGGTVEGGAIGGTPLATMNTDSTLLAGTLQQVLLPALTTINDYFATQLNIQFSAANLAIGTDMPTAITNANAMMLVWVEDGLQPTAEAAAAVNAELVSMIANLKELAELDKGDWEPGSPTPFEIGLRGINEELGGMNGMLGAVMPQLGGVDTGGGGGGAFEIHLHVGAMLGSEADAYRFAQKITPYINKARRTQKWD